MLMQRVITALLLLPVLLGMIWFAPTPWLYVFFSAAGLMIAWEWTGLMRWSGHSAKRYLYVAAMAIVLFAVWAAPIEYRPWLFGVAAVWWVFSFILVSGFPQNFQRHPPSDIAMSLLGLLLISSTLLALATLHAMPNGVMRLIYLFFLIFAADTGAYFAGRTFGKHKLAPNVSPGKTIEGAIGGVLLCGAWSLVGGHYIFQAQGDALIALFVLSMVIAVFSIVGDLTESMFKRHAGIKDSGNILPGHGGILDRVDSILSAAPVMVLGLLLLNI
ncbi:phosphatidate cytidylyltransferase [Stenotrophobium rhamnosiphilum]|uniref:Phosphatidate cytidylyltransferase n=1 Tax=Stenotrophobium rhamnosiphilum TaxID=2029166 RepID=A0A2T5MHW2_9GAMM|nr:phosphatidate cytidylyltransferase [Stenotrophobium rhamnosiphilum]PTU32166.1 phosphatidate cytidylyltransferase [Stenotrophobium rhamnosiphilum]